ncbi:MAG: transglutaminase-like domain-containing protein [Planctomycetia bacterium]|nr:transglutaminase-like domain-containing protein [Planctomycetia bacterium]
MTDEKHILGYTNAELGRIDPVSLNLRVAIGIPQLADLNIPGYQAIVDDWTNDIRRWLKEYEPNFYKDPGYWCNDINFFNLGVVCEYIERELGIQYKEDQRDQKSIRYTNPSDLFLNGLIDTRRGTCGNMAALHHAIGWRLGWPVSLACAASHLFLRYDNGLVQYNVEATQAGFGGMSSPPDEYLVTQYKLTPEAISTGSDLRALKPSEVLGVFLSLRARHFRDVGNTTFAERDYLLARYLVPSNRHIYAESMGVLVIRGMKLFHIQDEGSPWNLAEWIRSQYRLQQA